MKTDERVGGWTHKQREALVVGARVLNKDGRWYEVSGHDPKTGPSGPSGLGVFMDGYDVICELDDFVPGRVRSERPERRLTRIQTALDSGEHVEGSDVAWLLVLARRAIAARAR